MERKPRKPRLAVVGTEPGATGMQPPRKLGKLGRDLWATVQREFNVTDSGGVELLMQACEAADRVGQLGDKISRDGLTVHTKQGMRSHPLLREETSLRNFVCKTLRAIGIVDEPQKPMGRPGSAIGWRGYDD
jgi:hypothetical protein